jgi:uncharacterized phage protein (TIGR01671 family)
MREIKFRVWNIDEYISLNKAVHDDIVVIQQPSSSNDSLIEINWEGVELEQFTGMHDKNGVPIYEGDILSSPHFDNNRLTHSVLWSDKYNGWFLHNLSSSEIYGDGSVQMWVAMKHGPYEVIGNIHQHAHLLEQNKC